MVWWMSGVVDICVVDVVQSPSVRVDGVVSLQVLVIFTQISKLSLMFVTTIIYRRLSLKLVSSMIYRRPPSPSALQCQGVEGVVSLPGPWTGQANCCLDDSSSLTL